jgi:hypothetical protein
LRTADANLPSNRCAQRKARGGSMQDLGWLFFVFVLFAGGRALVRMCERLM